MKFFYHLATILPNLIQKCNKCFKCLNQHFSLEFNSGSQFINIVNFQFLNIFVSLMEKQVTFEVSLFYFWQVLECSNDSHREKLQDSSNQYKNL